jgi:SAM-dependent methyltransferase
LAPAHQDETTFRAKPLNSIKLRRRGVAAPYTDPTPLTESTAFGNNFVAICDLQRSGAMSATMTDYDKFNLMVVAESPDAVDRINKEFYSRFTYPWPPLSFPLVADPYYGTTFLNQELGDWTNSRIPHNPKIWVAGCGTNQAIFTALRFPEADVLGTDISTGSLSVCQKSASECGIKNLRLEEQSLNSVTYREQFDYILCTGVIHHNADPTVPLARFAEALKPDGVIELMVYNYYHRILTTACQKAIRHLFRDAPVSFETQFSMMRRLMDKFPLRNTMGGVFNDMRNKSEPELADCFLQPVEFSYTIESLGEMLKNAGLEYGLFCVNQFDKIVERLTWNMEFEDEVVAHCYEALPDEERWQITNLLSIERSPFLWFYVQRRDSSYKRKTEHEVGRHFLKTRFERYTTTFNNYVSSESGYCFAPESLPFPGPRLPNDVTARNIFKATEPKKTFGEVLKSLNIEPTFHLVNRLRALLTTPLFPYLKAVQ